VVAYTVCPPPCAAAANINMPLDDPADYLLKP
jgi:hypothetical protein